MNRVQSNVQIISSRQKEKKMPYSLLCDLKILLPEFYFVDREDALFRTLKPKGSEQLRYEGHRITPLIPLNSKLLDFFTASDLSKMLTFEMKGDDSVEVYFSTNQSGFEKDYPNICHSRTYLLKAKNALEDVPVLEFWPNFQAPDWQEYYLFYFDKGQDTFSIDLRDKFKTKDLQGEQNKYQIYKLKQFPEVITCYLESDYFKQEIGVIFFEPPKPLLGNDFGVKWKVGVDFGTSFTNVFINHNDIPKRLDLEPRLLQLADLALDIRDGVLIEFFIADNPVLLRLPLSSVLSIRPYAQLRNLDNGEKPEPFLDGRIYIPEDITRLKPQEPYLKTGLKWDESSDHQIYIELFLKHLALEISALAKSKEVSSIEWFVSYPSTFSHTDKVTYSQCWEDITERLQQTTGIKHTPPRYNDPVHFRSESIAIAQYWVDMEDKQLLHATCLTIDDSMSNISIIENNQLRYQCSIQLASYHLLTQFMEAKPELLVKLFELNQRDWVGIKTDKFAAKFDVLMRQKSAEFLRKNRQTILAKDLEFQGLLQLITLGSAGLYYYIGIILRVLHNEGRYKKGEITPVYLGGNGSQIFDWLAAGGKFKENSLINQLFRKMLLLGSGWEESVGEVTSHPSSQPKSEVACGLVLSDEHYGTLLEGWDDQTLIEDTLIAGEFCQVNGKEVTPYERMPDIKDKVAIENFQLDESFQKLKEFVLQFNQFVDQSKAMKELGLKPIIVGEKEYKEVTTELTRHILNFKGKKGANLRVEPAFILALKKLLEVLSKRWAKTTQNNSK